VQQEKTKSIKYNKQGNDTPPEESNCKESNNSKIKGINRKGDETPLQEVTGHKIQHKLESQENKEQ